MTGVSAREWLRDPAAMTTAAGVIREMAEAQTEAQAKGKG
jgi:hypothetical protein